MNFDAAFYILMQIEKGYIRIDGKTTPEQRNYFCNKFQTKDSLRAAILSIFAANAGLNLLAASLVIFGELFWNPGVRFLKSLIFESVREARRLLAIMCIGFLANHVVIIRRINYM